MVMAVGVFVCVVGSEEVGVKAGMTGGGWRSEWGGLSRVVGSEREARLACHDAT